MKKEISPDMYNYNKYPGPSFARVGDRIVAEGIELQLVQDYREAFHQLAFSQRFSPLLLKFDYIVGDWGNEQLRLKGFYQNDKVVQTDQKIGRLEDYLLEFCNFGCAYFVLENPSPQEPEVEIEEKPRKKRGKNRPRQKEQRSSVVSSVKGKQSFSSHVRNSLVKESKRTRPFSLKAEKDDYKQIDLKTSRDTSSTGSENQRHFTIRQK